jgi:hypothetical protein
MAHWANKLSKMCCSARDTFKVPYHNTHGTTLYGMMLDRPDLHIQWHNASSGGYYLCIGCANCSSVTGHYQPQNHMDDLGLNPLNLSTRALKESPEVQRAFRLFIAEVLGEPSLGEPSLCRHLHCDQRPHVWWYAFVL